jgi:SSS family transporter
VAYASDGGDLRFLQLTMGYVVGRVLIVVILLPQYFRGHLYTAYEVLDRRFGGATKQTASVVFLIARNLADGLRLFLTALVLLKVLGLPLAIGPLSVCVAIVGIATIVYTFFGGMKSVVWNDCLQFIVYVAGGLLAGAVLLDKLPGGWTQLAEFARAHDKFRVFDFRLDLTEPYTIWAGLIGGMFLTLATHGTDQMMVQRYLCARSQRDAARALVLSGFVVVAQFALFLLLGVGLACFYQLHPPATAFEKADQVFAAFIVDELPAGIGLIGVILAAVFAAAMSTLSSSLNSSAAAAVNDLYLPSKTTPPSTEQLVWTSRMLTIFFGTAQMAVAILAFRFAESVVNDALTIASLALGLLLGVFALGVFTTKVGQKSAMYGLLAGLAVVSAAKFLTPVAWPWYTIIGAATTYTYGWTDSTARRLANGLRGRHPSTGED